MTKIRSKTKCEEIVIPELDEIAKNYPKRKDWTPYEEGILIKYAPLVRVRDLLKHLPDRTVSSIEDKIKRMREGGFIE